MSLHTRYADDLYFSSSQRGILYEVCNEVEAVIETTIRPKLAINQKKTYHGSRKRRMIVTGLRITPDAQISVGRDLKRKIRVFAHRAKLKTIKTSELGWLHGMLSYISSIEPQFSNHIRSKYGIK
jgi:RNA-directed DNA polymerase